MKKMLILIFVSLLFVNVVFAIDFEKNYSVVYSDDNPIVYITQLKYDPYPVNPGEYFDLWFKAEKIGRDAINKVTFELVPEYPFSLDSNENATRVYEMNNEMVLLKYKVRVDKDAVEGTNNIKLKYNIDGVHSTEAYKSFDIDVVDAQTDFDLVVQEISGNEASIAIANTGKNVAYSVIVRIPEQDAFQATGVNGQMVGNLENGDYTLVGFEIASEKKDKEQLKVQIDYTDEIGERRTVIKSVAYGADVSQLSENMTQTRNITQVRRTATSQQQSMYQKWWFWAIIIVLCYGMWKGYEIYKKKKEHMGEGKSKDIIRLRSR